jgi:hypothetical protein
MDDASSQRLKQGWRACACDELKPKGTQCCWRCIDRHPEFSRLDKLIAAGWGAMPQTLIPEIVMEAFATAALSTFTGFALSPAALVA